MDGEDDGDEGGDAVGEVGVVFSADVGGEGVFELDCPIHEVLGVGLLDALDEVDGFPAQDGEGVGLVVALDKAAHLGEVVGEAGAANVEGVKELRIASGLFS